MSLGRKRLVARIIKILMDVVLKSLDFEKIRGWYDGEEVKSDVFEKYRKYSH